MQRSSGPRNRVSILRHQIAPGKTESEGTSIALIFVDARQAFYAIIRKLVLSVMETVQAVVSLFHLRIPPAAIEELKAILSIRPTVRDIASTFTASHFEVRGSSNLGSAHKGTRLMARTSQSGF